MSAEPIRVLVAVAEAESLRVLRDVLPAETGAFVLTVVPEGEQPLDAIERDDPDVLILGLPLYERLRDSRPELLRGRTRRVILVAEAEEEERAGRAVAEGCLDYLLRPEITPALVRHALRYAVESCRTDRHRRDVEQALAESERRYRSLFEQSRDAIFMTRPTGELVEVNEAAYELLGHDAQLIGQHVLALLPERVDRQRFRREMEVRGHVREFEVRLRGGDGLDRWCLVSAWIRRDPTGEVLGYQGIVHDISARKEVEEQLAHEAFHDGLTTLPNRALFMDRLERAVARRRRGEERELAVLFLDLDRFKVVNDSLGHLAGDELLRRLGHLLLEQVREEDTVARIGGDEFAILLDGVDDPADSTHVAERIQERLRKPFRIQGHDVFTSVSIGITFGGAETLQAEDLLRDADTAMYRAKELGPARYQIFDERMHAHAVSLLQLETDLRLALDRQEFVLHYQPFLDLADQRLLGFEALIRWRHPRRGLLQPRSFISIAEDTGLIVPMGEWVLRTAARQLRTWQQRDDGHGHLFVSVNLANRQLTSPGLVDLVRDVLLETELPPGALRLELAESVLMRHPESVLETLRELRNLGVGLCIDDFGTGYSSLSYLHDLPLDSLKIDRSFIRRMEDTQEGTEVVATIMALARRLGLRTIAEGVETEYQLELLRTLGPGSVQGFLLSAPLEGDEATTLLRGHSLSRRSDER